MYTGHDAGSWDEEVDDDWCKPGMPNARPKCFTKSVTTPPDHPGRMTWVADLLLGLEHLEWSPHLETSQTGEMVRMVQNGGQQVTRPTPKEEENRFV